MIKQLGAEPKRRIYLRPPVAYYGGKQSLLGDILPLIPSHFKYVEPFLGGGAVFWAKEPSAVEIINDLDGFVVNFYRVLKSDFIGLKTMIESTAFGRETHEQASVIRQQQRFFSPLQCAWAFWVLANASIYSVLDNQCVTPGADAKPSRTFYRKANLLEQSYADRFLNVFIEQRDALYVIERNDDERTFCFVDPPYFQSDMGHYGGYTREDFVRLLEVLSVLKGRFLLTSYPSDVLDEYAERVGWRQFDAIYRCRQARKASEKQRF